MLSEISQTHKEKNCMVSYVEKQNLESVEAKSRTVVTLGWG